MRRLAPPEQCIACGAKPRSTLRLPNDCRLLRCPDCGLGWWNWPDFEPAELYGQAYFQSVESSQGYDDYAALEPGLRRTARARLSRICSLVPQACTAKPRLLDVGCGTGVFLDEAARQGWQVEGLEVSPYASAEARRRNLRVQTGAIEDAPFPAAFYDCITLWDVLEHLRDPAGVLARVSAALRPRGVLALSTGDVSSLCAWFSGRHWHLFSLPEHLFFFSPTSLRRLLGRAGLRVARVTREVYWAPLSYVRERLAKTFGRSRPTRRLVFDGCLLPASLFDVIGVYAVRRSASAAAAEI
jgi:SAM-dependent methyltransferase